MGGPTADETEARIDKLVDDLTLVIVILVLISMMVALHEQHQETSERLDRIEDVLISQQQRQYPLPLPSQTPEYYRVEENHAR